MSALTNNEREGLDEVFLSIHSSDDKYQKIKDLATLLLSKKTKTNIQKLIKQAKIGLKETNVSQYLANLGKKKNNLSK